MAIRPSSMPIYSIPICRSEGVYPRKSLHQSPQPHLQRTPGRSTQRSQLQGHMTIHGYTTWSYDHIWVHYMRTPGRSTHQSLLVYKTVPHGSRIGVSMQHTTYGHMTMRCAHIWQSGHVLHPYMVTSLPRCTSRIMTQHGVSQDENISATSQNKTMPESDADRDTSDENKEAGRDRGERADMIMCYTHIWSCDHALCPYMGI